MFSAADGQSCCQNFCGVEQAFFRSGSKDQRQGEARPIIVFAGRGCALMPRCQDAKSSAFLEEERVVNECYCEIFDLLLFLVRHRITELSSN